MASSANSSAGKDVNPKKSYRLKWNERNEIMVTQGLIDFRAVKGKNPLVNVPDHEIHEYLMGGYMSDEDYTDEFVEKLESLKKKLFDNKRKLAEEPSSLTPFDTGVLQRIFRNEVEPSKPNDQKQKKNDGQSSSIPSTRKNNK